MNPVLQPANVEALADAVRSAPCVLAVGGGTKPRLSAVSGATCISTARLTGIIEYEPTEFTFTALAGTLVRDIVATLATRGQYLPFDPLLVATGATLGGTVASGLNGPGRQRFGGLRDFILGVRMIDGSGRLLRLGGKVVKNAAGFDVPKFLVGSLGRFGVLAEITFKVFPIPPAALTLRLPVAPVAAAIELMLAAANSRWEPHALEYAPPAASVYLRLAGPETPIRSLAEEILARWPGEVLSAEAAAAFWTGLREFAWAHPAGVWMKVATAPRQIEPLSARLREIAAARWHVGAAGNVLWLSLPAPEEAMALSAILRELGLSALTLRGAAPLWPGVAHASTIARAVKTAFDPDHRFPSIDA